MYTRVRHSVAFMYNGLLSLSLSLSLSIYIYIYIVMLGVILCDNIPLNNL